MYYVNQRWLGGMLTNFTTIKTRIARLKDLEKMQEDGTFDVLPKKEVAKLMHEMEKLQKNVGGIKEMKKVPDMMFIVDTRKERIAVQEAHTPVSYTHLDVYKRQVPPLLTQKRILSKPLTPSYAAFSLRNSRGRFKKACRGSHQPPVFCGQGGFFTIPCHCFLRFL